MYPSTLYALYEMATLVRSDMLYSPETPCSHLRSRFSTSVSKSEYEGHIVLDRCVLTSLKQILPGIVHLFVVDIWTGPGSS